MGKPLIHQRRGKGSPLYRVYKKTFKYTIKFPKLKEYYTREGLITGEVLGFRLDPARTAVIMEVGLENGEKIFLIAPEGIKKGDIIEFGEDASVNLGNVLALKNIPEGTSIYNIELTPFDGGKLVRSAGTSALVVSHEGDYTYIKLPSRKIIKVNNNCRAQIGKVSMGGRLEKPLMKAGRSYYIMKAKSKKHVKVRGVAMNPVAHPHGGKEHHTGKPTTVKRTTPPGRKVGHIAARRTGRKKR